jgi:glycosyltransferase involved in cell wall biosynthesis
MTVSVDRDPVQAHLAVPAAGAMGAVTSKPLVVLIATPFGAGGRGGIDRLTDLIIGHVDSGHDPDLRALRLTVRGGRGHLRGVATFAAALARLAGLAMRRRVGLVHLNVAVRGSVYRKFLLSRVARTFGVPYIVHLHSGRFSDYWDQAKPPEARLIRTFLRDSAGIIVLGDAYRSMFESRMPEVLDKVHVLPNGTRARATGAATRSSGTPARITFLGRLSPLKGTPQLIEALGRMKGHPDWSATLAGDGDLAPSRARIAELGIADRVDLPGWLGSDDVDRLLAETDIVILPSFTEGLPMTIIEAFGAGIAVVATRVNAVGDVVQHERNGLLVEAGDVDGIAQALTRLVDDPELRQRLGETGRNDHREKYDQDACMTRLTDLWRRVARPARAS